MTPGPNNGKPQWGQGCPKLWGQSSQEPRGLNLAQQSCRQEHCLTESGEQSIKPKRTILEPSGLMEFAPLGFGLAWNVSLFSPFFWNGNGCPVPVSLLYFRST